MISRSTLTISWIRPDLEEERWEYFNHPAKQEWYRKRELTWEAIEKVFSRGALTPYPRAACIDALPVALSYSRYEEYQTYLARAKRGYRQNYSRMEDALQKAGSLTIKAPIVLKSSDEGLLFSGYRRLCLAWNYGMVPSVWLIPLD